VHARAGGEAVVDQDHPAAVQDQPRPIGTEASFKIVKRGLCLLGGGVELGRFDTKRA
jgi:hypothetical protein